MKRHIPNFITLLNLSCGSLSLLSTLGGNVRFALIFIALAILFDFLDGLSARLLNAGSELGRQLDSLADLVSFGLVPAAMIYMILLDLFGMQGNTPFTLFAFNEKMTLVSVLIVPAMAALRLGKFNLQHVQNDFMGLPTPAFALFWIGIYYDLFVNESIFGREVSAWFVISIMLVMAIFMIIPLPMLSLKTRNIRFRENIYQYLLIGLSFLILLFTGLSGLPLVILSYILLSLTRIVLT